MILRPAHYFADWEEDDRVRALEGVYAANDEYQLFDDGPEKGRYYISKAHIEATERAILRRMAIDDIVADEDRRRRARLEREAKP